MEAATRLVSSLFYLFSLYLLSAGYIHSSSYSQSSYNWRCNASRSLRSLPLSFFSLSFSLPFARCRYSLLAACRGEVVVPLSMLVEWTGSLKVGHFGFSKSWSCMTSNFLSLSSSRSRARKGREKEERRAAST